MLSSRLMLAMIMAYLVVAITSAYEKNYPRAVYFLGAIIISIGVLMMK